LAVPDNRIIKEKFLLSCYDTSCTSHLGETKKYDLVALKIWWPNLRKDVDGHCQDFVIHTKRVRINNQKYMGVIVTASYIRKTGGLL
jgi:hypothetical protein